MSKIKVKCVKEVTRFFKEGNVYIAEWIGDGESEPLSLLTMDETGDEKGHIIAFNTLEDNWFKKHFQLV